MGSEMCIRDSISAKKEETLAEAAEAARFERKNLNASSLEYVYLMHVVQERRCFSGECLNLKTLASIQNKINLKLQNQLSFKLPDLTF